MTNAIPRLSFHARVLMTAVIPAVLIAVALAWYFTMTRVADWDKALYDRGLMIARQMAPASEYGVFSGNAERLAALARTAKNEPDVDAVVVIDAHRRQLAAIGDALAFEIPKTIPGKAGLIRADDRHHLFAAPIAAAGVGGDEQFGASSGFGNRRSALPIGMVLVQMDRDRLQRTKNEQALSAALITFAGLLVAGWLARLLSQGVTRPVMDLAATVAALAHGNLYVRASIDASGSLKLLEQGINEMAHALANARNDLELRIRKATTELQAQKEVAEEANRTKSRFLAAASHDLRQPLQALGLFANALRRQVTDSSAAAMVERIERSVESLANVLDALLDISRLDAGVVEARPVDFPLATMFATLEEAFSETARTHGLALVFVKTGAWARSDPMLLERIVANLISNALRYTAAGRVLVGCRRDGEGLRIEVRDTGRGIADADLKAIFREFVQVGTPQPGRDKGLGLGLSIVGRLGQLLGHRISVRSQPGRGSVFGVAVARGRLFATPPIKPPIKPGGMPFDGRCIAVIEDEPEVRGALASFLAALGADVEAAADHTALIQVLTAKGTTPDAVVTDYRLAEDLTGLQAAAQLLTCYGPDLPVILVTGESDPDVLARLARSGFPVLHKPVRADDLAAAVAAQLETDGPASRISSGAIRAA